MINITRKAVVGGVVGTILMTLLMKFGAPLMIGQSMDIGALLSNMLGVDRSIGMGVHLALGIVVFPLVYAIFCYRFLPGPPTSRGIIYGLGLWLVAATVIMPMAGSGFFWAAAGGAKAAMAALVGHVVYGAALGTMAGRAQT